MSTAREALMARRKTSIPKERAITTPPFLQRPLQTWATPKYLQAENWRKVVRMQPLSILARNHLVNYLQALPYSITAKDDSEKDELEGDIDYYISVLNDPVNGGFDGIIDLLWQDALDLPVGGNVEIVRWPVGILPSVELNGETASVTRSWSKGHTFKIVPLDGATMFPTYDTDFPMAQRVDYYNMLNPTFFKPYEVGRILMYQRPEIYLKGYAMPPPEAAFLAVTLLTRGDKYYADLLLDTPPAGILDLRDMEQATATQWVSSFRDLLGGIDPYKIGVLYEHQQEAKFIAFSKPPTELMYDTTTLKYARILVSFYGLNLGVLGLEENKGTMAGAIRDKHQVALTGYGMVNEKTTNLINDYIIPPYLKFAFLEQDFERQTAQGRAFVLFSQALKNLTDSGIISSQIAQAQLRGEGFITVEVDEEEAIEPEIQENGKEKIEGPKTQQIVDKVPVDEGGKGDATDKAFVTKQSELDGPGDISSVKPRSPFFSRMDKVVSPAMKSVTQSATTKRLNPLIDKVTRLLFPGIKAVITKSNSNEVIKAWLIERASMWYNLESVFDDEPDTIKASQSQLDDIEDFLKGDWYFLPNNFKQRFLNIYQDAYSEGSKFARQVLEDALRDAGLDISPAFGIDFDLSNPLTLKQIDDHAADLVTQVNDGTKFYLKRMLASGVEEGLSSPEIAQLIRDGENVSVILDNKKFIDSVLSRVKDELGKLSESRANSIVNTEINRAESQGRLEQWKQTGLTKKAWVHTGPDKPCPFCTENIAKGLIPMDEEFTSVFGVTQTPPAHPQVDHCHLEFDENELIDKAGELTPWDGS